jgi:hypothetical protein
MGRISGIKNGMIKGENRRKIQMILMVLMIPMIMIIYSF